MEVHTSVDEADVGNVRQGQPVTFTVDAFPARRFRGKVHQVRNAPTIIQNVVTYDAVVRIDNKDFLLKPGMTANVQFLVSEKEDALTIPNMALRFKPAEEKNESQELLRQEQSRTAPRVGARQTSRAGGSGGPGGDARRVRQVKVYLLKDGKAQPVEIQVGITDGSKSEVMDNALKENDPIIIGMSSNANQGQSTTNNPFQPAQPRVGFR
jgi:HlyD family secretion protein